MSAREGKKKYRTDKINNSEKSGVGFGIGGAGEISKNISKNTEKKYNTGTPGSISAFNPNNGISSAQRKEQSDLIKKENDKKRAAVYKQKYILGLQKAVSKLQSSNTQEEYEENLNAFSKLDPTLRKLKGYSSNTREDSGYAKGTESILNYKTAKQINDSFDSSGIDEKTKQVLWKYVYEPQGIKNVSKEQAQKDYQLTKDATNRDFANFEYFQKEKEQTDFYKLAIKQDKLKNPSLWDKSYFDYVFYLANKKTAYTAKEAEDVSLLGQVLPNEYTLSKYGQNEDKIFNKFGYSTDEIKKVYDVLNDRDLKTSGSDTLWAGSYGAGKNMWMFLGDNALRQQEGLDKLVYDSESGFHYVKDEKYKNITYRATDWYDGKYFVTNPYLSQEDQESQINYINSFTVSDAVVSTAVDLAVMYATSFLVSGPIMDIEASLNPYKATGILLKAQKGKATAEEIAIAERILTKGPEIMKKAALIQKGISTASLSALSTFKETTEAGYNIEDLPSSYFKNLAMFAAMNYAESRVSFGLEHATKESSRIYNIAKTWISAASGGAAGTGVSLVTDKLEGNDMSNEELFQSFIMLTMFSGISGTLREFITFKPEERETSLKKAKEEWYNNLTIEEKEEYNTKEFKISQNERNRLGLKSLDDAFKLYYQAADALSEIEARRANGEEISNTEDIELINRFYQGTRQLKRKLIQAVEKGIIAENSIYYKDLLSKIDTMYNTYLEYKNSRTQRNKVNKENAIIIIEESKSLILSETDRKTISEVQEKVTKNVEINDRIARRAERARRHAENVTHEAVIYLLGAGEWDALSSDARKAIVDPNNTKKIDNELELYRNIQLRKLREHYGSFFDDLKVGDLIVATYGEPIAIVTEANADGLLFIRYFDKYTNLTGGETVYPDRMSKGTKFDYASSRYLKKVPVENSEAFMSNFRKSKKVEMLKNITNKNTNENKTIEDPKYINGYDLSATAELEKTSRKKRSELSADEYNEDKQKRIRNSIRRDRREIANQSIDRQNYLKSLRLYTSPIFDYAEKGDIIVNQDNEKIAEIIDINNYEQITIQWFDNTGEVIYLEHVYSDTMSQGTHFSIGDLDYDTGEGFHLDKSYDPNEKTESISQKTENISEIKKPSVIKKELKKIHDSNKENLFAENNILFEDDNTISDVFYNRIDKSIKDIRIKVKTDLENEICSLLKVLNKAVYFKDRYNENLEPINRLVEDIKAKIGSLGTNNLSDDFYKILYSLIDKKNLNLDVNYYDKIAEEIEAYASGEKETISSDSVKKLNENAKLAYELISDLDLAPGIDDADKPSGLNYEGFILSSANNRILQEEGNSQKTVNSIIEAIKYLANNKPDENFANALEEKFAEDYEKTTKNNRVIDKKSNTNKKYSDKPTKQELVDDIRNYYKEQGYAIDEMMNLAMADIEYGYNAGLFSNMKGFLEYKANNSSEILTKSERDNHLDGVKFDQTKKTSTNLQKLSTLREYAYFNSYLYREVSDYLNGFIFKISDIALTEMSVNPTAVEKISSLLGLLNNYSDIISNSKSYDLIKRKTRTTKTGEDNNNFFARARQLISIRIEQIRNQIRDYATSHGIKYEAARKKLNVSSYLVSKPSENEDVLLYLLKTKESKSKNALLDKSSLEFNEYERSIADKYHLKGKNNTVEDARNLFRSKQENAREKALLKTIDDTNNTPVNFVDTDGNTKIYSLESVTNDKRSNINKLIDISYQYGLLDYAHLEDHIYALNKRENEYVHEKYKIREAEDNKKRLKKEYYSFLKSKKDKKKIDIPTFDEYKRMQYESMQESIRQEKELSEKSYRKKALRSLKDKGVNRPGKLQIETEISNIKNAEKTRRLEDFKKTFLEENERPATETDINNARQKYIDDYKRIYEIPSEEELKRLYYATYHDADKFLEGFNFKSNADVFAIDASGKSLIREALSKSILAEAVFRYVLTDGKPIHENRINELVEHPDTLIKICYLLGIPKNIYDSSILDGKINYTKLQDSISDINDNMYKYFVGNNYYTLKSPKINKESFLNLTKTDYADVFDYTSTFSGVTPETKKDVIKKLLLFAKYELEINNFIYNLKKANGNVEDYYDFDLTLIPPIGTPEMFEQLGLQLNLSGENSSPFAYMNLLYEGEMQEDVPVYNINQFSASAKYLEAKLNAQKYMKYRSADKRLKINSYRKRLKDKKIINTKNIKAFITTSKKGYYEIYINDKKNDQEYVFSTNSLQDCAKIVFDFEENSVVFDDLQKKAIELAKRLKAINNTTYINGTKENGLQGKRKFHVYKYSEDFSNPDTKKQSFEESRKKDEISKAKNEILKQINNLQEESERISSVIERVSNEYRIKDVQNSTTDIIIKNPVIPQTGESFVFENENILFINLLMSAMKKQNIDNALINILENKVLKKIEAERFYSDFNEMLSKNKTTTKPKRVRKTKSKSKNEAAQENIIDENNPEAPKTKNTDNKVNTGNKNNLDIPVVISNKTVEGGKQVYVFSPCKKYPNGQITIYKGSMSKEEILQRVRAGRINLLVEKNIEELKTVFKNKISTESEKWNLDNYAFQIYGPEGYSDPFDNGTLRGIFANLLDNTFTTGTFDGFARLVYLARETFSEVFKNNDSEMKFINSLPLYSSDIIDATLSSKAKEYFSSQESADLAMSVINNKIENILDQNGCKIASSEQLVNYLITEEGSDLLNVIYSLSNEELNNAEKIKDINDINQFEEKYIDNSYTGPSEIIDLISSATGIDRSELISSAINANIALEEKKRKEKTKEIILNLIKRTPSEALYEKRQILENINYIFGELKYNIQNLTEEDVIDYKKQIGVILNNISFPNISKKTFESEFESGLIDPEDYNIELIKIINADGVVNIKKIIGAIDALFKRGSNSKYALNIKLKNLADNLNTLDNRQIELYDLEEIYAIAKAAALFHYAYNTEGYVLLGNRFEDLDEVVFGINNTINNANIFHFEASNNWMNKLIQFIIRLHENSLRPNVILDRIDDYTGGYAHKLSEVFENSERTALMQRQKIDSEIAEFVKSHKSEIEKWAGAKAEYIDTGIDVTTKSKQKVRLICNKAQLGFFYMVSKDTVAMENLFDENGGVLLISKDSYFKDTRDIDIKLKDSTLLTPTEEEFEQIVEFAQEDEVLIEYISMLENLREELSIEITDSMEKLLGDPTINKKNRAVIIKKAKSGDVITTSENSSLSSRSMFSNATISRTEDRSPFIILDINDAFAIDFNALTNFSESAVAIEAANKIFNARIEFGNEGKTLSLYDIIKLKAGNDIISKTLQEIFSRIDKTTAKTEKGYTQIANDIINNIAGATLGLNPNVVLAQFGSYFSAAPYISAQSLIKAFFRKPDLKNAKLYNPYMRLRAEKGGDVVVREILESKNPIATITRIGTLPINAMDIFTTALKWNACVIETEKILFSKGIIADLTSENMRKNLVYDGYQHVEKVKKFQIAGALHEKTIKRSDPSSSQFWRSNNVSTHNPVRKVLFGLYKSQLNQMFSELYDHIGRAISYSRRYGKTSNEYKAAKKTAYSCVAGIGFSSLWITASSIAISALFKGLFDDCYDENGNFDSEKFIETLFSNGITKFMSSIVNMSPIGGIIMSVIDTMTNSDRYYKNDMVQINFIDAFEDILSICTDGKALFDKSVLGEASSYDYANYLLSSAIKVSKFIGVPLDNGIKYTVQAASLCNNDIAAYWDSIFYGTNIDYIRNAKSEKDINSAVKVYLDKNYENINLEKSTDEITRLVMWTNKENANHKEIFGVDNYYNMSYMFVSNIEKIIDEEGYAHDLTPDQQNNYKKYASCQYSKISELFDSIYYKELTDEEKYYAVKKYVDFCEEYAKDRICDEIGIESKNFATVQLSENGCNMFDYSCYKAQTKAKDCTSDLEKKKVLVESGLSDKSISVIYNKEFESENTSISIIDYCENGGSAKVFVETNIAFSNIDDSDSGSKTYDKKTWLFTNIKDDEDVILLYHKYFESNISDERYTIQYAYDHGVAIDSFYNRLVQKQEETTEVEGVSNNYYIENGEIIISPQIENNNKSAKIKAMYDLSSGDYSEQELEYFYSTEYPSDDAFTFVLKSNIKASDYIEFQKAILTVEPDYDEEGNEIKNSKKNKIFALINEMNLSKVQKEILFGLNYSLKANQYYDIIRFIDSLQLTTEMKLLMAQALGLLVVDGKVYPKKK